MMTIKDFNKTRMKIQRNKTDMFLDIVNKNKNKEKAKVIAIKRSNNIINSIPIECKFNVS